MALPPEPLATVKVDAVAVCIGEVTAVVATGPALPKREGKKGEKDLGNKEAWQEVVLRVDTALLGLTAGQTLTVLKPEGAYLVDVGTKGAFLLAAPAEVGGAPAILGRYGPDTWRADDVVATFTR